MYPQIKLPKTKVNKKKKRGSIAKDDVKKYQQKINKNNNFWDINEDNDEIINFNNIPNENNQLKPNLIINKDMNKSIEKPKNFTVYEKYKNLLKNEDKEKNYNFNYDKLNLFSFINNEKKSKNKNDYRNNSVDLGGIKKMKKNKVDYLSVFERNKKWLETRKEKLNKEKEKYYNKKEKEMMENTFDYNKINRKKDININNIFNEEDNVALRPENYKFFMRLIQGRQERERSLDLSSCAKINCLKKSHYSGRQNGNISQREMRKYIKFIHNELKDINNQN